MNKSTSGSSRPEMEETGQKVHQIRLAKSYFDDVTNEIKTFELRKNDRGYKKGDILEMMEFADGKNTGRTVKVLVTYILEDYTGIEDGYCIMATKLMKDGETIKEQQEEIDLYRKKIRALEEVLEEKKNAKPEITASSEETIRLQTERDTYKTMYEQLLNRLVNGGAA